MNKETELKLEVMKKINLLFPLSKEPIVITSAIDFGFEAGRQEATQTCLKSVLRIMDKWWKKRTSGKGASYKELIKQIEQKDKIAQIKEEIEKLDVLSPKRCRLKAELSGILTARYEFVKMIDNLGIEDIISFFESLKKLRN